jgi:hypothetical protein
LARERVAFANIEKLRARQNYELRAAMEAENAREAEREVLLASTRTNADRSRLQKLIAMERERSEAEMMGLTAEHELALAERFAKLGLTR